ncbi:MAG TPA: GNAT family N-acetyltransferase [Bacteroidales bacterium]|nr:GNAT family N-acetyltransferase [Bacteroidales bacterium]
MTDIQVLRATSEHEQYAQAISDLIYQASKDKDAGLAQRAPNYIINKMREGKAVIALAGSEVAGFCYIETWQHGKFVANSGLIVSPNYRGAGLAKRIKQEAFNLSRDLFPQAKLFGLTTSESVMKINNDLGYRPVSYAKLTDDDAFWKGCESCANYDILQRMERKICLCTGMIYDPDEKKE